MQLDATKIYDPCKPCSVIDNDFFCRAARREREGYRPQPLGALRWCALLVEGLAFSALDVPLEDERTVPDSSERARRDRQVVANQIQF